jgi:hypothetical protein
MPAVGRSPSGRYYAWNDLIREARKVPGVWQTLLPDAPTTVVATVKHQRHRDLRHDDGHLEARARNHYTDARGKRRANIDLRWVPDV